MKTIEEIIEILDPIVAAANQAELKMTEHGISENATTGLGLKFKHLFAVRDLVKELGRNKHGTEE
jgi:hypothetical protein